MLGLGLGSLAGGWVSKRPEIRLLPLLALIELATAAFGIVSLGVFEQVGAFIVDWSLPAMALVNLLLVLIPTLLMGATLPILVSHLVRRSGEVGGAVGLLYYVNTMGAGAACLVCCGVLFPFLGMRGAVFTAVGFNVMVAAGAILAHAFHRNEAIPAGAVSGHRTARCRPWPPSGAAAGCARGIYFVVLRNIPVPDDLLCIRVQCNRLCRHAGMLSRWDRRWRAKCRERLRDAASSRRDAQGCR